MKFLTTAFLSVTFSTAALAAEHTNMNLVLAVDVSESIGNPDPDTNVYEFSLMKNGIVAGLLDSQVAEMLEQCNADGIGITYLEWAGLAYEYQVEVGVPWVKLKNRRDLARLAEKIKGLRRSFESGSTDVDFALRTSHELIANSPYVTEKNIVQISSDGRQNIMNRSGFHQDGAAVDITKTRDKLVASGATIQALLIVNDENDKNFKDGDLKSYYKKNVIGGRGNFVEATPDFNSFAQAYKSMLMRELSNCGM